MYFYTVGQIVAKPTTRTGKDGKTYTTVKLILFGGMTAYAFVTGKTETALHSYVGVKISPQSNGNATYTICDLNDSAKTFITSASQYVDKHSGTTQKTTKPATTFYDVDDDDELPF